MPIYEYVCAECDLKFEELRPLSKANEGIACPRCQNKAERVFSTFCSVAKDESGAITPTGGSSCSSCSTDTCNTCGI